ncbi:DUF1064 domain-containing protein [Burkholderia pseudomallei]|uniref:DUF1064 domain-containing protein n=1 Tax=Burkholderia pseudomallei TaxID=28450 RepID=UPI00057256F6|nr:DUF1064 domain-containing protein [Burkholderia pseudomallei]
MTKRASRPLVVPEGTAMVGTARVRDDRTIGRSFAERELARRTGKQPNSEFDEIASGDLDRPLFTSVMTAKRSKYRNTKCEHDGIRFDSKRERSRWFELIKQQDVGLISGLRRQVVFELAPGVVIASRKRPALRYIADFVYTRDGVQVVEDVKGAITGEYRIKRHLMKSVHDIDISEIK